MYKRIIITTITLLIFILTLVGCSAEISTPPDLENGTNQSSTDELLEDEHNTNGDDNISLEPTPEDENRYIVSTQFYIKTLAAVNIRKEASTSSTKLGTTKKYEILGFIEKVNDNWYAIEYKGQKAFISALSIYTVLLNKGTSTADMIENIITVGNSQYGKTYVYGATRLLNSSGNVSSYFTGNSYDCSSFVQFAYYVGAGIKLAADSRSQSINGSMVSFDNMKRGDLLFMTNSDRENLTGIDRIGHVAIYLGNDMIMHTYGSPGVIVENYSSLRKSRTLVIRRML